MQTTDLREYALPAMLTDGVRVSALNESARGLFPSLREGAELPDALLPPEGESSWAGSATLDGYFYRVRGTRNGGQIVYTFDIREQRALSEEELDGALRQVRALMADFYSQLAPCVSDDEEGFPVRNKEGFSKSYYRLLRLMDHLDLLRDAAGDGVRLDRQELDLDRLCALTALECDGLLREIGVRVVYEGLDVPVFVSADEARLRDALLELISNCAKRLKQGGTITLCLKRQGKWARLRVTDDAGPEETAAKTSAVRIPASDMGANVADTLARLHGGALFFGGDKSAPAAYLTLPTVRRVPGKITLRTARFERNAGMSPYIIALSDVLPGRIVREDWKD